MEASSSPLLIPVKFKVQQGVSGTVEITDEQSGAQLACKVAKAAGITEDPSTLKLVLAGKRVLLDSTPLREQRLNLKSSLLVMRTAAAASPSVSPKKVTEDTTTGLGMEVDKLEMYRRAASSFAKRSTDDDGHYFAEITDQFGNRVEMPEADRRNLIAGQTLQEHGRKLLAEGADKAEDALHILMEADKHFSQVSLALLAIVDNYGYLCLDIAWAHYRLQKIENLKDAREKLRSARNALERAHGRDMERLQEVKGEGWHGEEKTMYVRLYLLQGVVAYHRGEFVDAASYLRLGEDALNQLLITDEELTPLLGMGFTLSESRRAMRTAHKDQERAVELVMKRREELRQREEAERLQRRQRRLGKTSGGGWVDMTLLDQLCELGFERDLVVEALKQTNNDYGLSVDALTTTPELLMRRARSQVAPADQPSEETLAALQGMGFTESQARRALAQTHGVMESAVELLLTGQISVEEEAPLLPGLGGGGGDNGEAQQEEPPVPEPEETLEQRIAREKLEHERVVKQEAQRDLIDTLAGNTDPDAMFDLDLREEQELLVKYRSLLMGRGKW